MTQKLWIQQAIRTEQLESVPHRYDEVGRGGEEGRLEAGGAALEGGVEGTQHQEVQQHDQGDPGRLQGVDHLKMIRLAEIGNEYRLAHHLTIDSFQLFLSRGDMKNY